MHPEEKNMPSSNSNIPAPGTGNASNPSPGPENTGAAATSQLLDKKAEKYLRESGNIEDMPDPDEQNEADNQIKEQSE